MDIYTSQPIEDVKPGDFKSLIEKPISVHKHAINHLSSGQRKVFKEKDLLDMLERENLGKYFYKRMVDTLRFIGVPMGIERLSSILHKAILLLSPSWTPLKYQNTKSKMKKNRHLDGSEQGEFLYDYKYDILTFKIKNRDYKQSFEFQNFSIDMDVENFITGIRIFDASKVSGIDKYVLNNIVQGEFHASMKNNIITVRIKFVGEKRNKMIPIFAKQKDFTQQFTSQINSKNRFDDSEVSVPSFES